jgi:hypothetical protein
MFVLMGVFTMAVLFALTLPRSAFVRWGLAGLLILLAILLVLFLQGLGELPWLAQSRDASNWYDASPWREAILFAILLVGMLARGVFDVLNDYTRARSASSRQPIRKRLARIIAPIFPAILLFQPVLSLAENRKLAWPLLVFSFQNGFFWDAFFSKMKQYQGKRL